MNFRKNQIEQPIYVKYKRLDNVLYIPTHVAKKERLIHPDVEYGYVSSVTEKYIFVKFLKQLVKLKWNDVTAQACSPGDLLTIKGGFPFNLNVPIPWHMAIDRINKVGEKNHKFWRRNPNW